MGYLEKLSTNCFIVFENNHIVSLLLIFLSSWQYEYKIKPG
jgi:hypothetical protein